MKWHPPTLAAMAVLAAGLALTGVVAGWQAKHRAEEADGRFDVLAQRTADQVAARMRTYEYGLRGARGAVLTAGADQPDRERFRLYSRSRDIDREFPGARGIGLIRRVAPEQDAAFVDAARRDGAPDFAIRQLAPHAGERFVIQYIEPLDRNRQAIGLDVASEVNRRRAAEQAMRGGAATLTGPITLVQASGQTLRSFLLLLPVYRQGATPPTEPEREASAMGWTYAALVIDEVLHDIAPDGGPVSMVLLDRTDAEPLPFFGSHSAGSELADTLMRRIPLAIYGRQWEAELRSTPRFVAEQHVGNPHGEAALGAGIAVLLAILTFVYGQGWQRARLALAERSRLAAIVASSNDAIIGETPDGVVTDWNQGAERLFGYTAEEAIGRSTASLLLPEGLQAERAAVQAALARDDAVLPFDTQRRRRDGTLLDVSMTVSNIVGPGGHRLGRSATLRDISQAKRAEAELRELNASLERKVQERTVSLESSRRDMQTILDAMPSQIGYWDRHLINRFANRQHEVWYGIDTQTLRGQHVRVMLGEPAFESSRPYMEAALHGQAQVFERASPAVDGSQTRQLQVHYLPDIADGEVRGLYVIAHDVSELTESRRQLATALRETEALLAARKQAETDLLHANQRYTLATEGAGIGVWELETDRGVFTWDARMYLLFGHDPQVRTDPRQVWDQALQADERGRYRQQMSEVLRSRDGGDAELHIRRADGEMRHLKILARVQRDSAGRAARMVGVAYDITAEKLADQQVRAAHDTLERRVDERTLALQKANAALALARDGAEQASRAKSAFLATMSHEIRTPMNGMVGMLEVLARDDSPQVRADAMHTMRSSAFSLLHIIDDILDFSKIEAGHMALERVALDLPQLVEDACALLVPAARAKAVSLHVFIDPRAPTRVWGDPTRLRQVIDNLLSNAIKFSGEHADRRPRVAVRLEAGAMPDRVQFSVSDQGVGMTAHAVADLFTPFTQAEASTTRRFGGTGLGLAICKRLVDLMGGVIDVDSAVGRGTTFTVGIDLQPIDAAPAAPSLGLAGLTCIVSADPQLNADDLHRTLAHAGAEVVIADDAVSAAHAASAVALSVVLHRAGEAFDPAATRVAFVAAPGARHVVLLPGHRLGNRAACAGMLALEEDALSRSALLRGVAVAAGRASPEVLRSPTRDDAPPMQRGPAPSVAEARRRGQLILVAEDDPINRKVIVHQLGLMGLTAEVAVDGLEALRSWRQGRYALLLTDLHMPGLDGHGLARAIRGEETSEVRMPILALTANAVKGEADLCLAAGMDEYLTKPIRLHHLQASLQRWLPHAAEPLPQALADAVEPARGPGSFDVAVLVALVGGDAATAADFLTDYMASARRLLAEMRQAADGGDAERVGSCAHKLKSSSRSVGALRLGELCADLENASQTKDRPALDAGVAALERQWAVVVPLIEAELR
jgi:PAS domain S-box-containing protein